MSKRNSGFALIEVVIMIVVLGILSAVAIPAYVNLQKGARQSAEDAVIANVRTGISLFFAEAASRDQPAFPPSLDTAKDGSASEQNPFFTTVLQQEGVTRDWKKEKGKYAGPTGTSYTYDSKTGKFVKG
jgi:MSHA pilin protein MshA